MSDPKPWSLSSINQWLTQRAQRGAVPTTTLMIVLATIIGVAAGYGAVLFTLLINAVTDATVSSIMRQAVRDPWWRVALCLCPGMGLLAVAWFTRQFAPEAQGHGVPEVITAVGRHDGVIRPRVSLVKILASGVCIGTGGSIGREGPIVQIGSSMGSVAGQIFKLSAQNIKVLVAAGAAAGISATFNAPLAGVVFASEIILADFAAESLMPIVIASVLANVVQQHVGEHGMHAAFPEVHFVFRGDWVELPSYMVLGLCCGVAAVFFTRLLYATEDASHKLIPRWWLRAVVLGTLIGVVGTVYPLSPAKVSDAYDPAQQTPALFGVGYGAVDHALHLENAERPRNGREVTDKSVRLMRSEMLSQLWWLLPLALLKPFMTSLTLAGGGSGGIFAPSLFIGATMGGSFGLVANLMMPGISAEPGLYAIVGMGAVVAGTTHGVLSAILIVYELTNDYRIILPIMIAAGLSSIVARVIDHESIYDKKLSRRGERIARGHDAHRAEHVMVRDVMITDFPTITHSANLSQIIRVARGHPTIESLPVMNDDNQLVGIIRPEDLHRVLDSDAPPTAVNASDIALTVASSVQTNANLLEALREFGSRDIETLPVLSADSGSRELVGLLQRSDVMRRYRIEMLRRR